jgi:hypothetical protein
MQPDDNAPTVPNPQVARPGQPNAPPPGSQPPVINATGKAPIWQVSRAQPAAGGGSRTTVGSFGLGFGIALVILAVMVLALVIALNVNDGKQGALGAVSTATAQPTPTQNALTPTATALPPITNETATSLVTQFYLNIRSQNLQNAYNLLSDSFQARQTIQEFQQEWGDTQSLTVDPNSVQPTSGDSGTIVVKLTYAQVTKDTPPVTNTVNASVKVGYEHNNLRILVIDKQVVPTTPTPQPTATAAPQPTDTPAPATTPTPSPSASPTATSTPTK